MCFVTELPSFLSGLDVSPLGGIPETAFSQKEIHCESYKALLPARIFRFFKVKHFLNQFFTAHKSKTVKKMYEEKRLRGLRVR